MVKGKISESAHLSITVKPTHLWDEKISSIRKSGVRKAKELRKQGKKFHVEILGPREVGERDTVPLTGITIKLDWKVETKLKMVESAKDMTTNACLLGSLDPAFPTVLKSIIEGKGLYEHGIGEFFLLYGKFEQKYQLDTGKKTRDKMLDLLKGKEQHLKAYIERGKTRLDPLPYAVKNIMSHVGNNPNKCEEEELRTSIRLLKSWVTQE